MKVGIKNFGPFKKKISKMKMILDEVNFIFREDGLYLKEKDITDDNLIYLHLNRNYFDDYDFSGNISYKVNLFNFYYCLKTLSVEDKLYLSFSDEQLNISSIRRKKEQSYCISILKNEKLISEKNFEYHLEYHNILEIDYSRDNKLEDMGDFQFKDISLEVKDKKLFLETKNDDIHVIREVQKINFLRSTDYNVKSIYKYRNIQSIFSFLSLSKRNILSINNKSPLKLQIYGKNFELILISSNISIIN